MKKIMVSIVLMLFSISIYAQKPLIKIIDIDGKETKYNIENISQIDFVKSNKLYSMVVYKHDTTNKFLTLNIQSIGFVDSNKIKINLPTTSKILYIGDIDSISFVENICSDVTIGTQTWMCKNLDVDHYRNGDPIPEVQDSTVWANLKTGAWCYYNNYSANGVIYGKLYNWYAVNDPRGLSPEGWHIPTNNEWILLTEYLSSKNGAGCKLKSIGTIENGDGLWQKPNEGATNESGFSALPGGHRGYLGKFELIGYFGSWWSYVEFDYSQAWLKRLYYDDSSIGSVNVPKYYGLSIRCVKDTETPTLPKINSVSPDPVSMGDILTINGENFGTKQDSNFVSIYSKKIPNNFYQSWSDTEIKVIMPKGNSESTASVTVNGLKSNDVAFNVVNTSYPPQILNISSDTTILTDVITIKGKNFGELIDSGFVLFNEIKPSKSNYISWNDSLIILKIPDQFVKGNITVNVYGTKSSNYYYAIKTIEYSTVTDIDGNVYKTIKIGNQWWMAENLKVSRYLNGDTIPVVKDPELWKLLKTGALCYYNNDPSLGSIYGKLYNWYAVNDYRGLAPEGWHVPREAEWNILLNYCGGESIAGGKLKSNGTVQNGNGLWNSPNVGATNSAGFSANPGGERMAEGSFIEFNNSAYFWTMNSSNPTQSIFKQFVNNQASCFSNYCSYLNSMSIRCVKGPEISPYILSLTPDTVVIGEILTINGKNFGDNQGNNFVSLNGQQFLQSDYQSWTNNEIKIKIPLGTISGNLYVSVNEIKTREVNLIVIRFRYGKVTDIDGNIYKTIKIGDQVWFADNLNVTHYRNGDVISEVKDSTEWANMKTGAWCYYNNNPSLKAKYGKLYNCFAVNDPRGLAPVGWHIANDDEWNILFNVAGGLSQAGGKLKEVGTTNWVEPNTGATDEYGFLSLPGGARKFNGIFMKLGTYCYFWSSSFVESVGSNYLLTCSSTYIFKNKFDFKHGFSVRCAKD